MPQKRKSRWRVALTALTAVITLALLASLLPVLTRARRENVVLDIARHASDEFSVPLSLVLAVIRTESDFRAEARSEAGAIGLMQLMPDTFLYLAREHLFEEHTAEDLYLPTDNIRYGTYYLSYLHGRFGSWSVAVAAYNAGEGRVAAWLEDPRYGENGVLVSIPFAETKAYLAAVWKSCRYYSE